MEIPKNKQRERLGNGKMERWATFGEVDSMSFKNLFFSKLLEGRQTKTTFLYTHIPIILHVLSDDREYLNQNPNHSCLYIPSWVLLPSLANRAWLILLKCCGDVVAAGVLGVGVNNFMS